MRQKKQGILLYLKQHTSQQGSVSSECFQLAKSGGVSDKEMKEAIRAGLDLYEERMRLRNSRQAA